MRNFINWTIKFVGALLGVSAGMLVSFWMLDTRDQIVAISNEDPIWEMTWFLIMASSIAALVMLAVDRLIGFINDK